jgi:hypothetical protein
LSTERYGSGTHTWDVPVPKFVPLAFNGWAAEVTYLASTGCTKCSILLFYRRLTKGSYNTLWKYAILTAIAFTALYSMAFILMLIFSCSPTEAYWKSFNPYYEDEFHCINSKYSNVLSGAMSVLSDLYSVLLPFVMLRNFDAPRRQKIALNIIFSLGLLVVAAGSVRTYYLEQVGHSSDLTWVGYDVYIWAQLETQLALICASAPTLRVFFRDYLSISVLRALSSARTGSRRDTRRASKRLPDDSTDSNRTGDSVPLTKIPTGKPNSLASLREVDDLEAASPPYDSTLQKEIATSRADAVYSDYSLDAGILPAAYPPLREKQPFEDDPHGRYQLYPGKG